jgi:hypothetical protein
MEFVYHLWNLKRATKLSNGRFLSAGYLQSQKIIQNRNIPDLEFSKIPFQSETWIIYKFGASICKFV